MAKRDPDARARFEVPERVLYQTDGQGSVMG